jgi:hypothetical protein
MRTTLDSLFRIKKKIPEQYMAYSSEACMWKRRVICIFAGEERKMLPSFPYINEICNT